MSCRQSSALLQAPNGTKTLMANGAEIIGRIARADKRVKNGFYIHSIYKQKVIFDLLYCLLKGYIFLTLISNFEISCNRSIFLNCSVELKVLNFVQIIGMFLTAMTTSFKLASASHPNYSLAKKALVVQFVIILTDLMIALITIAYSSSSLVLSFVWDYPLASLLIGCQTLVLDTLMAIIKNQEGFLVGQKI